MKATIILTDGRKMTALLDSKAAPISVRNFVALARDGFYHGLIFHRVIPGFMIQGGGMDEGMRPKKAASIKGEFSANGVPNDHAHTVGTLSMARTMVPDSASSQFFICVEDCEHLDGQYAAFGQLADDESVRVAKEIASVPTTRVGWYDDVPIRPIVIDKIEIED